jgi:DNA-binding transcriptional regulator GbsR (MarR family)
VNSTPKELNQLKIDYINFMKQSLRFDEENTISILFTLLMEQDYLTQDQIMEITGLSRAAVSETLKIIISNTNLPILKTRKQDSKKNYYYAPFLFDQYIKNYLLQSLPLIDLHMSVVPNFIHRLEQISEESLEKKRFENYLMVTLLVSQYYKVLSKNINDVWDNYQKNPNYKLTLSKEFHNMKTDLTELIQSETKKSYPSENLRNIKKDFINYAMNTQIPYGRSRELSMIGLIVLFEPHAVTQDYLIDFTNYGRSTVSEALSRLVRYNFVEIVKKPDDRKKYYKTKYTILDYAINRFKESVKIIDGILFTLKNNFLKRIQSLKVDEEVKKKYHEFFNLNIKSYGIISKIINIYFTAVYDKLNEEFKD